MQARELIKALQLFPPDTDVLLEYEACTAMPHAYLLRTHVIGLGYLRPEQSDPLPSIVIFHDGNAHPHWRKVKRDRSSMRPLKVE